MSDLRVEQAWTRYRRWLERVRPALLDELRPPVEAPTLAALEQAIGQTLPPGVVALWRLHDGQRSEQPGLLAGFNFLSAEGALDQWQEWAELRAQLEPKSLRELSLPSRSLPQGAIQRTYTCAGWLPLWKEPFEGNYLGVDLAPGPQGTVGQVINFGRDEDDKAVLAGSLEEILERLADDAERGLIQLHAVEPRPGEHRVDLRHARGRFLSVLLTEVRERLEHTER